MTEQKNLQQQINIELSPELAEGMSLAAKASRL